MPIQTRARKPGHFDAQDQTHATEANLSHKPLKLHPTFDGGPGVSEVIVDDHDCIAIPAELAGPFNQRIL
jgi:glycerate kinase